MGAFLGTVCLSVCVCVQEALAVSVEEFSHSCGISTQHTVTRMHSSWTDGHVTSSTVLVYSKMFADEAVQDGNGPWFSHSLSLSLFIRLTPSGKATAFFFFFKLVYFGCDLQI